MIKVGVFYPKSAGKKFDMKYYLKDKSRIGCAPRRVVL